MRDFCSLRTELARMAVPKLVLNGLYSCVDFTRAPVFRSKHTLQWSSKMPKTELKPFLTILGTRTRAEKKRDQNLINPKSQESNGARAWLPAPGAAH